MGVLVLIQTDVLAIFSMNFDWDINAQGVHKHALILGGVANLLIHVPSKVSVGL